MKRLIPASLLVATLVVVMAFGASGRSATATGPKTIRLVSMKTTHSQLDLGQKGMSPGDLDLTTSNLRSNGTKIGKSQGYCVLVPPQNAECSYTLKLPQGQIALVAGFGPGMNSTKVAIDPIVGGTGAFAGARGYVDDKEAGGGKTELTIHLVP